MTKATRQHPNAPHTAAGRHRMVDCVLLQGWSVEATASDSRSTPRRCRSRCDGSGSKCRWAPRPLQSSALLSLVDLTRQAPRGARAAPPTSLGGRPHCPRRGPGAVHRAIDPHVRLVGRLDRADRATAAPDPVRRYHLEHPGELVHFDFMKLARIPEGGGWRLLGRSGAKSHSGAGYRYLHTAIDDRTRLVYSEIHDDEKVLTAAAFWVRAAAFYADHGIKVQRVLTDNGSCYRSGLCYRACAGTGTAVKQTRVRRPQTNGKL